MASSGEEKATTKKQHNDLKRPRPEAKAILRGHVTPVSSVCFHAHEEHAHLLFTGEESGVLRLWDTRFEETLQMFSPPERFGTSPVQGVAQHVAHVNDVLVQYKNGFVARLNVEYKKNVSEFDAVCIGEFKTVDTGQRFFQHEEGAVVCDGFCKICYVDENTWVGACGDGDECIVIRDERAVGGGWATTRSAVVGRLKLASTTSGKKGGMVMAVSAAGGTDIMCGYEDGSVAVWDVRNRKAARSRVKVGADAVTSVTCSPRGRVGVAAGAFDEIVAVADLSGDTLAAVAKGSLRVCGISEVSWRADGKVIASGGWDGAVRIWDGRRRADCVLRRIGSLRWHEGSVLSVGYSSDSKLLASGGKDCTVAIWEGV